MKKLVLVLGLFLTIGSVWCAKSDSYLSSLTKDGKYYYENSIGMELAYVAPGTFDMGRNFEVSDGDSYNENSNAIEFEHADSEGFQKKSPESKHSDEIPVHKVTITKPYLIGKYEVTQSEYQEIMGTNPSVNKGINNPVEKISWNDAVEFCRKLTSRECSNGNLKSGYVYRLPTEAEWEFAARGGNKSKGYTYSGSNSISSVAWYEKNSGKHTHPVGQKSPNELGLYDMSGNVWEWCQDWYGAYPSDSVVDPKGVNSGSKRVIRGACCFDSVSDSQVTNRHCYKPDTKDFLCGFRIILAAE